jgi:hypothetical protein
MNARGAVGLFILLPNISIISRWNLIEILEAISRVIRFGLSDGPVSVEIDLPHHRVDRSSHRDMATKTKTALVTGASGSTIRCSQ